MDSTVTADSLNPGVYSTMSEPYGVPYSDWVANYWKWWLGMPSDIHPVDGFTPEKCASMQEGPVWFLPDVPSDGIFEQSCTIPFGKSILFPLSTGQCDFGIPDIDSDEELRECATEGRVEVIFNVEVDGVKLKGLEGYRATTNFFNVSIPNNPTKFYDDLKPGVFRSMADGHFVFLEPLSQGKHTIKYSVNERLLGEDIVHYRQIVYHILVK